MVDFVSVKINRLSDSVVLQHLWNSIDDLVVSGDQPSKSNVIERCNSFYAVDSNDINKNLFLALKEGTISRNVKTDVLSRLEIKEDRSKGDWYCFLCHKVGSDTHCRRCGTSFHKVCNCDLSDQFHCHICRSIGQFFSDFKKFSSTTQLRIICRVLYVNKIKWRSLNIIGYIQDDSRNNFFIYKVINAIEIDNNLSLGKYFLSSKSKENFLFDLLLLRHNCAVIYGTEHEFSKSITCYIKHLNTEIENIYCESCFLLYSKIPYQKLNSSQKNELFSLVCDERHPLMWGLVPPNVFWPFKLISEDKDKYYGIKFSKSIQVNRSKVESFSKEISLTWSSYSFQISDRPSAELLKAFSLAQIYAKNLLETPKYTDSINVCFNMRSKKSLVKKFKTSKLSKSCNEEVQSLKIRMGRPCKGKVGRPPKGKVGRPPSKKQRIDQKFDKKTFLDNISSTESSVESVHKLSAMDLNLKKGRKRIKDVFVSDNEKSLKMTKSNIKKSHNKKKRNFFGKTKYGYLSSTESESNYDDKISDSCGNEDKSCRSHKPKQSSSLKIPNRTVDKNRTLSSRKFIDHKIIYNRRKEESYSSNDTIPQRASNITHINSSDDSRSECEVHEIFSRDDIRCNNLLSLLTHRRSHCNFPHSSKYSAYSSSLSQSYNCTPDDFSKSHLKRLYEDSNNNSLLPRGGKDILTSQSQSSNLETGLYCSSSSPVNFSPISNNHQPNVTQVSMQSTPSSNYHNMSCDESTYQNGSSNLNMKIVLKNRAFQMSSPLQLGINIDPKIQKKCQTDINSLAIKRSEFSAVNKKTIMTDYNESDY